MIQEHTKLSETSDVIVKKAVELSNWREKLRDARNSLSSAEQQLARAKNTEADIEEAYKKCEAELKALVDPKEVDNG